MKDKEYTLQQAKDFLATEDNWSDWDALKRYIQKSDSPENIERWIDKAAELYHSRRSEELQNALSASERIRMSDAQSALVEGLKELIFECSNLVAADASRWVTSPDAGAEHLRTYPPLVKARALIHKHTKSEDNGK